MERASRVTVIALVILALLISAAWAKDIAVISVRVVRVIDGDTIHVRLDSGKEERVRLIGIDTPEGRAGRAATAFTRVNLQGRDVYLELGGMDRHRRLLAYVWLERPTKGDEAEVRASMFNAILLLSGHARVMTVPPNTKYASIFRKVTALE